MAEDHARFTKQIHTESVDSVQSFLSAVFRLRETKQNTKLLYRGLADTDYELVPTIGRPYDYADKQKVTFSRDAERNLLHRFRRRAHPHLGRAISAGEAIFLARHYGLPTRLLDWTANALYALYFSCSDKWRSDARVWAMDYVADYGTDLDVFKIVQINDERELFACAGEKAIKMVHPVYSNPRLLAQDGAFTFHSDPWKSMEEQAGDSFDKERLDVVTLDGWTIPQQCKIPIIKELSGLGITERTLFPELEATAKSLWQTELLWAG